MKIFNFFKKIGKSDEAEEMSLEKVKALLEKKLKAEEDKVSFDLDKIKKQIENEKEKLEKNLLGLCEANLKNPDIGERVKQLMEGNRKVYLEKMEVLLKTINISDETMKTLRFAEAYDKNLEEFSKSIFRSHNIVQEFFPVEAGTIVVNLKNIDKFVKNSKKIIENSDIERINRLMKNLDEINEKIKRKENGKNEIKILKDALNEKEILLNEKESQLKEIEERKEYIELTELNNEKAKIIRQLKDEMEKFLHLFYEIEPGLKKYCNLNQNDKLAAAYLENFVNAVEEDKELQITEIGKKITQYISEGKIEFKDRKREKILNALGQIDKEFFWQFLSRKQNLEKEVKELDIEISKRNILNEILFSKKEFNKVKEDFDISKLELEKTATKIAKIDSESLKRKLESEIKNELGEKIKII